MAKFLDPERIRIQNFRLPDSDPKNRNPLKFQESAIRGKSGFFSTDFCKNPNPTQKFNGLPSLVQITGRTGYVSRSL